MTDPAAPPEISIVIPLCNEEESLPLLAGELQATMRALGRAYEVLFVDDGSTDGSAAVLARLAQADPALRVLRLRHNAGQSAALAAGFQAARGGIVVTLDADLQNDPADIPRLLAELANADVVCGIRVRRQDRWLRRASARLANAVRNRVIGETITDAGCSLKAFRAEPLRRIPVFHGMHRFLPTLLRLAGARVTEIEVSHRPRRHGTPHYNVRNRLGRTLVDLWGVRWLQSRWIDRAGLD